MTSLVEHWLVVLGFAKRDLAKLQFLTLQIFPQSIRLREEYVISTSEIQQIERKWLLISGASEPPNYIQLSKLGERETRGEGQDLFLEGQSVDFVNIERALGHQLHNRIQNFKMKKNQM